MTDNKLQGEFVLHKKADPTPPEEIKTSEPETVSTLKSAHNHERKSMRFFHSLGQYPSNVTFLNQEADEEVILVIRRDFITNLPWIISMAALGILPIFLFILFPIFLPAISVSPTLIFLSLSFYYLVVFGFTVLNFAIWYFNVAIVTNKRIIDLDVPNILVRHLSEARLSAIVDVSYSQVGGVRSFFDYGDVHAQTEALTQNIEFDRAPNPNLIRKIIGELIVDLETE